MSMMLPPDLQLFVEAEISSGRYESEQALVLVAVRMLRETKERYESLYNDVQAAVASADRGELRPLDTEATMAEGERLLARRSPPN